MRLDQILYRARIKSRQLAYRGSNSSPFISGDYFAQKSSVSLDNPRNWNGVANQKSIELADVIFCPGDLYEDFIDRFGRNLSASTLILGNSDRDYLDKLENLPKNFSRAYRQNSQYFDDIHRFLPIGIENLALGNNGLPRYFDKKYVRAKKDNKILCGPFSNTHPERETFFNSITAHSPNWKILKRRLTPLKYAEIAASYRYVACPRGNGLDTHRFWETLYRGSYPIVLESPWAQECKLLGVPIVIINEWTVEEFEKILQLELQSFDPRRIAILWANYWDLEIFS